VFEMVAVGVEWRGEESIAATAFLAKTHLAFLRSITSLEGRDAIPTSYPLFRSRFPRGIVPLLSLVGQSMALFKLSFV
jgi:hypothetical protein